MRYFFILIPIGIFFLMHFGVAWRLHDLFDQPFRWKPLLLWFTAMLLNIIVVMTITMRSGAYNPFIRIWRVATETYLGLLFILLSALLAWGVVQWVTSWWRPIPSNISRWVVFTATAIYIIAALANAMTVRLKTIELTSPKIDTPQTIVLMSDLHLGPVHGADYVDKLVKLANEAEPDLVVFTGDLLERGIRPGTLTGFQNLDAPSYLVWGNHDRFFRRSDALALFAEAPFTLLEDDVVRFSDQLQVVGLNYPGFGDERTLGERLKRLPIHNGRFTLLLSHAPLDFPHWKDTPVDLQLAGHTHAGQIVPFNLVVRMRYRQLSGLYQHGDKTTYVTPGTGTWGPPLRLGTRNEVTCIRLLPDKEAQP